MAREGANVGEGAPSRADGRSVRLRAGASLAMLAPPHGDFDDVLRNERCHLIKDQRKVAVGVTSTARPEERSLYVKRFNVFSWRVRLASVVGRSAALRCWDATRFLKTAGFGTPTAVAAVEHRRWGFLQKSFFVTEALEGAVPADEAWWRLRDAGRSERQAFIAGLARLFAGLHAAGAYHNDLKDANILVRRNGSALEYYLLDLERLRFFSRVPRRRRLKNLVQLHRTLGRLAGLRENLYFLRVYLGSGGAEPSRRRSWRRAVCRRARWKDLRHALRGRRS